MYTQTHFKIASWIKFLGCHREGKSLRHVAMVAKFLDLNNPWSCKYGKTKKQKRKKLT